MNASAILKLANQFRESPAFGEIFRQDCYRLARVKTPPKYVLDIGANVGLFTLACKMNWPDCEVIALEPHGPTWETLGNTANAVGRVVPVWGAYGDGASDIHCRQGGNDTVHRYDSVPEWAAVGDNEPAPDETPNYSFRKLRTAYTQSFDLIKVDCEGAEYHVLDDPEALPVFQHATYAALELHLFANGCTKERYMLVSRWIEWLKQLEETHHVELDLRLGGSMIWLTQRETA
jgi:FkbM family methyltransferase